MNAISETKVQLKARPKLNQPFNGNIMKNLTSLFPSVSLNADYVEHMAAEAEANGLKEINPEKCGYVLVDKCLVPLTFIARIKEELSDHQFDYGYVISESEMFEADFLQSLSEEERAVLMPCVLILIERGDLGFNLFEDLDELAEA
jgi:hypothetical protein